MGALQDLRPRKVRTWYGLTGEIVVEGELWHLVRVGRLALPHPPVVNFFIRRGLPREARLQFSYWHELGHLQTLPLAVAYGLWLWARRPRVGRWGIPFQLGFALLLHEGMWEMASEGYVMLRGGAGYREMYRRHPNGFLAAFWGGLAALLLGGSLVWSPPAWLRRRMGTLLNALNRIGDGAEGASAPTPKGGAG